MKPRMYVIVSVVFVLLLSSLACSFSLPGAVRGSGNVVTEDRDVSQFTRISVGGGMQLEVVQEDAYRLTIEAEDNIFSYIVSEVRGEQLVIKFDTNGPRSFSTTRPVRIKVSLPEVAALDASGGSRMQAKGLQGSTLDLTASGGSQVDLVDIRFQTLRADISGGSQADISGVVEDQTSQISGGSQYRAGDLRCSTLKSYGSGGGQADVWVEQSLEAELSGGSQVRYYGEPRVTQNTSGGSTVRSRGLK
jgi:hypothetical protein